MVLPCKGAGITLIDPGPSNRARQRTFTREERTLRAYVTRCYARPTGNQQPFTMTRMMNEYAEYGQSSPIAWVIEWRCGIRKGFLSMDSEGYEWVHGHGERARDALLATRQLRRSG